jgi:predicted N-acetyltransferase YhbS
MVGILIARSCHPAELPMIVASLDEEFIHRRQRSLSLALRYPKAFAPDAKLLVCETGGQIVSALVVRPIDLFDGQYAWHGAMIGMVHTQPAWRGRGSASFLLRETAEILRAEALDFAVLWSRQSGFYARLGWTNADRSVFGTLDIDFVEPKQEVFAGVVPTASVAARIEAIRTCHGRTLVARTPTDYASIPLPAENVFAIFHNEGSADAYALIGKWGAVTIIFEMCGTDASMQHIWKSIRESSRQIWINDEAGSSSYQWFSHNADVNWESRNFAMWLPLSQDIPPRFWDRLHLPFFDRI